jgi:lipopolysaccharide biosynthesis glycosyltransferase
MKTYWVITAYGEQVHLQVQTYLLVTSMINHLTELSEIIIATDHPEHYHCFKDRVTFETLDRDRVMEWTSDLKFFFKIKPFLLTHLMCERTGNIVWLDSDTFCHGSLVAFEKSLSDGKFLMHVREYKPWEGKTKEQREYKKRLTDIDLSGHRFTPETWMWNAGIVGIPHTHTNRIHEVRAMIETMENLSFSPRTRLKEQLAFSIFCQSHGEITPAQPAFLHYWGNKEGWYEFGVRCFLKTWIKKITLEEFGASLHKQKDSLPHETPLKKSKSERRKAKIRRILKLD